MKEIHSVKFTLAYRLLVHRTCNDCVYTFFTSTAQMAILLCPGLATVGCEEEELVCPGQGSLLVQPHEISHLAIEFGLHRE